MIKYSSWKDRMSVRALRKYRMSDVTAAKLSIKTIKMQSTATFVNWHSAWSVDKKLDNILNLMINLKEGMSAKFVIASFIFMRWWKRNKNKFKKQIKNYWGKMVLGPRLRLNRSRSKEIVKIKSNIRKCMKWIKKK